MAPGFAPGEHFYYSNVGYRAVGVVLETVTGRSYAELVQRRVLDRLGMRASVPVMVHETRRRLPGGHVPFYDDRPWERAHGLVPGPWVESAEADGCLCCSPEDLARYLRALWAGEELLSDSSRTQMRTAHARSADGEEQYGYGVELDRGGFGHGGDMLGYVAHMWADTEAGLGVVAFANGIGGARALGEAALEIAQGRTPSGPDFPPRPRAARRRQLPAGVDAVPGSLPSPQSLASDLLDRRTVGNARPGHRLARRQRAVPIGRHRRGHVSRGGRLNGLPSDSASTPSSAVARSARSTPARPITGPSPPDAHRRGA